MAFDPDLDIMWDLEDYLDCGYWIPSDGFYVGHMYSTNRRCEVCGVRRYFKVGGLCSKCENLDRRLKLEKSLKLEKCQCGRSPSLVWWHDDDPERGVGFGAMHDTFQIQCRCGMQTCSIEDEENRAAHTLAAIWNAKRRYG